MKTTSCVKEELKNLTHTLGPAVHIDIFNSIKSAVNANGQ